MLKIISFDESLACKKEVDVPKLDERGAKKKEVQVRDTGANGLKGLTSLNLLFRLFIDSIDNIHRLCAPLDDLSWNTVHI